MKKILLVAGARPNFMKIAPILRVIDRDYSESLQSILVHTGQHYDENLSQAFFDSLNIKTPDYNLKVGSGTHAEQTAAIMSKFEDVCKNENPDIVLVVGDVNSTIAAGLVAKKLCLELAHVEAGLRSRDRTMPEEINRLTTDAITDLFFTTERGASDNLLREGHQEESIHFVGHVMIDNLYFQLDELENKGPSNIVAELKGRLPKEYLCMTMHRPSNVDNPDVLGPLLDSLYNIAQKMPIAFPCHPRTKNKIESFGLEHLFQTPDKSENKIESGLILLPPLNYNDFLYLWKDAFCVLTDSGGLQEETTALGIPCLTLRENTERPITISEGTNTLIGQDPKRLQEELRVLLHGESKQGKVPELWDGKASRRITEILNFQNFGV